VFIFYEITAVGTFRHIETYLIKKYCGNGGWLEKITQSQRA
jgi:hypothetical protein